MQPNFWQRQVGFVRSWYRRAVDHLAALFFAWQAGLFDRTEDRLRLHGLSGLEMVLVPEVWVEWEGWGTSIAWWGHFLGSLPQQDQDAVLDLLFASDQGLGFNIVRYNIGGCSDAAANPNPISPPHGYKAITGFKSSHLAPYDWSADSSQRAILLGAKKRGANLFEAFSNSPPDWMTVTGSCTGAWEYEAENLKEEHFEDFADYLTEVVKQYRDKWGIEFDLLEPFNEPSEGWWIVGNSQEGCNFSPASMAKLIPLVSASLSKKGLSTKVSGVDAWAENTPKVFAAFGSQTLEALGQINVHGYYRFEPDAGRRGQRRQNALHRAQVRELARQLNKPLWQSEAGPMNFGGRSETRVALRLALNVIMDINQMGVSAWVYWQALEVASTNFWGLLQAPFTRSQPFAFRVMKQFHVLKQFTAWIRPGAKILKTPAALDNHILSAFDPARKLVTIVIVNMSSQAASSRELKLEGFTAPQPEVQVSVYRTSSTEAYKRLPTETALVLPGSMTLHAERESITTYVLHDVDIA